MAFENPRNRTMRTLVGSILISIKDAIASQCAIARTIATGETWQAQFRAHAQWSERLRAWRVKIVGSRSDPARQEWQVMIGEFFQ
jgi:hypothetical protein